MSIVTDVTWHDAQSVEEEPEITLGCWHLVLCPTPEGGTEPRLIGLTLSGEARLRMTSRVVAWDWKARRATTLSGRVYRLDDEEELPSDSFDRVETFVAILERDGARDVSDEAARPDGWAAVGDALARVARD